MHELREVAASREQRTWRAYRARLYHFVLGRVGDEASAEDIVHDVLSKAYERRDTLRDPGKLGQWMYQIARNAIVDHYRHAGAEQRHPHDLRYCVREGKPSEDVGIVLVDVGELDPREREDSERRRPAPEPVGVGPTAERRLD